MDNDHYKSLKLSRAASKDDIKKSYRKLSHNYHPDRGGSMKEFTKVLDAYASLVGEKCKCRSESFIKHYNKNSDKVHTKRCKNIVNILHVTLEQIYNKETIHKEVPINAICDECHGIGIIVKAKPCNKCSGSPASSRSTSMSSRSTSSLSTGSECKKCGDDGYKIKEECACPKCGGNKIYKKDVKFTFNLNHKVYDNKRIYYYNKGNEYPTYKRGHILFIVVIKKHEVFKRVNEYDLYMEYRLNLIDALSGFTLLFKHLDGRQIFSNIETVTKPNVYKKIYGEGICKNKGDLIVKFIIEFPVHTINYHERQTLETIIWQTHSTNHTAIDFENGDNCFIGELNKPFKGYNC